MRVVITGANGHIGRRLIRRLNEESPETEIVALVRSVRAASTIERENLRAAVHIVDYGDAPGLRKAVGQCDVIVHLVGIIKASRGNTYEQAHESACRALVSADLGASHLVCLGVVGTHPDSGNACFRSRARAEEILMGSDIPASVLRVPMVLGPDDYATWSLGRNGSKKIVFTFRGTSLEQPIYSEDVTTAVLAAMKLSPAHRVLELAGPESLSRSSLIKRAGRILGHNPCVASLPVSLGYLVAGILEVLVPNPPVTVAMLGVLDHDDAVDVKACCELLGLELTTLDETLAKVLEPSDLTC